MTARERSLALGILSAVVVAGAAFLLYTLLLAPLWAMDANLGPLQQEVEQKEDRVREIEAAKARLQRWKQLSLPSSQEFSRRQYEVYLSDLLQENGFPAGSSTVKATAPEKSSLTTASKGPVYTRLPYKVVAHGSLTNLVDVLENFYRTPLLHQIRSLRIQRPSGIGLQAQQAQQLDIDMTVEALIVAGADNRSLLLPVPDGLLAIDVVCALQQAPSGFGLVLWAAGPTGPAGPGVLAQPPRHYAAIAKKNIFLGAAAERPAELVASPRFVHLVDITHPNDRPCQAFFYDRLNNSTTRLRAETGFDTFRIVNDQGETLLHGKVIRLDDRNLYFQADEDYYRMHVGDNLEEVMRHPLRSEELKVLGLTAVVGKVNTAH